MTVSCGSVRRGALAAGGTLFTVLSALGVVLPLAAAIGASGISRQARGRSCWRGCSVPGSRSSCSRSRFAMPAPHGLPSASVRRRCSRSRSPSSFSMSRSIAGTGRRRRTDRRWRLLTRDRPCSTRARSDGSACYLPRCDDRVRDERQPHPLAWNRGDRCRPRTGRLRNDARRCGRDCRLRRH